MPRTLLNVAGQNVQNKLLNGNFDFWQRVVGQSTAAQDGGYQADRFKTSFSNAGQVLVQRDTDVPTLAQSGWQSVYSARLNVNTADASLGAGDYFLYRQIIEGSEYASFHGKPFRLQFWIKSNKVGTYPVSFTNNATDRSYVTTFTVNSSLVWELKTFDLTADTAGTWLFDSGRGLIVQVGLMNGTTYQAPTLNSWIAGNYSGHSTAVNFLDSTANIMYLSQFALYPGQYSGTVPFQRAGQNWDEELRRCQRYYEKSYNLEIPPSSNGVGPPQQGQFRYRSNGENTKFVNITYKVRKRIAAVNFVPLNPITGAGNSWRDDSNNTNLATTVETGETSANISIATAPATAAVIGQWIADAEL